MANSFDWEFLTLLGLEEGDILTFMPDWLNARRWAGISEDDVRTAVQRCPEFWNLKLKGIRECILAYIRELVEASRMAEYKARGHRLLYGNMPVFPPCMAANQIAGKGRLHICHPEFLLHVVHNAFFCKSSGSLGCNAILPRKCRHCGINTTRVEAYASGKIQLPDAAWNWGFMCDEGAKTDELLQCMLGSPWHCVLSKLPHDASASSVEADDKQRVAYLAQVIREGQREVSSFTGIEVTDEDLRTAICEAELYVSKIEELTDLVCKADPQPLTGAELSLFSLPLGMAFESGYKYLSSAIDATIAEVRGMIARGEGVLPKGSPKLGCHFTPSCVPWVCEAFLSEGVNLSINTFHCKASMNIHQTETDDPYLFAAKHWLSQPNAVNMEEQARIIVNIMNGYPLDGMLYGFFSFDRWIGALQKTMIQIIEERTGVPHYYLEGDFWNDMRSMDGDRRSLISSIAHQLKVRKLCPAPTNE